MKYAVASKKQEALIARLCAELNIDNPAIYRRHRVEEASKLITKLLKQIHESKQQTLL